MIAKVYGIFKISLKGVSTNKVRSFLTMLGVIIGVASVILLVSIGNGIKGYVTDQFNELGSNLIIAAPGKVKVGAENPSMFFAKSKFSQKEIQNIQRYLPSLDAVTIEATDSKRVSYKNNTYYSQVYATDYNFLKVFPLYKIESGRSFNRPEYESNARVVILGHTVVEKLFKSENPLDKEVVIDNKRFKVIGVYGKRGSFGNADHDSIISVPFTTAQLVFNTRDITGINIKIKEGTDINGAKRDIKKIFLMTLTNDDFTLFTSQELLSSINNILGIITLGLAGIAAISLLVGGIGIMNIMLVSVTERTREIGLRKAVGATPYNILGQFLIESIILSIIGGINGILLGFLGSIALRSIIFTRITLWSVLVAFAFSLFVGIIFGTYPAYKAAKKSPIEALRFE